MTTPTPPEAQDLPALPEAAAFNCYWKGDNDSISWDQWHDASDPMPAKWTAGEEPDKVTAYYTADQMRAYARAALAAQQEPEAGPVAHGWLQDRGLLYRLTDGRRPQNRDEIRVSMADGSRSDEACARRAGELLDLIGAAPVAQQGAEPHPLDLLQAGFNNVELRAHWDKKLPGVEPTDRELSAFAVGTEVGFARARDLERQDWSRVWHALARAGLHPGRTDDRAEAVIDRLVAERDAARAAAHAQQPAPLTVRQLADVTAPWAHVRSDFAFGIARAAVAEFCRVNGIPAPTTGEG